MIEFYLVKRNCEKFDGCSECSFFDNDKGACLLDYPPELWDMEKLHNAYDELFMHNEMVDVFYKQVANKLLDVMHCKRGDKDENNNVRD